MNLNYFFIHDVKLRIQNTKDETDKKELELEEVEGYYVESFIVSPDSSLICIHYQFGKDPHPNEIREKKLLNYGIIKIYKIRDDMIECTCKTYTLNYHPIQFTKNSKYFFYLDDTNKMKCIYLDNLEDIRIRHFLVVNYNIDCFRFCETPNSTLMFIDDYDIYVADVDKPSTSPLLLPRKSKYPDFIGVSYDNIIVFPSFNRLWESVNQKMQGVGYSQKKVSEYDRATNIFLGFVPETHIIVFLNLPLETLCFYNCCQKKAKIIYSRKVKGYHVHIQGDYLVENGMLEMYVTHLQTICLENENLQKLYTRDIDLTIDGTHTISKINHSLCIREKIRKVGAYTKKAKS